MSEFDDPTTKGLRLAGNFVAVAIVCGVAAAFAGVSGVIALIVGELVWAVGLAVGGFVLTLVSWLSVGFSKTACGPVPLVKLDSADEIQVSEED